MVYVMSHAAHMSVIIVPASSIGESFVYDPAGGLYRTSVILS